MEWQLFFKNNLRKGIVRQINSLWYEVNEFINSTESEKVKKTISTKLMNESMIVYRIIALYIFNL